MRFLLGGFEVPAYVCIPDGDGAIVKGEVGEPLRECGLVSEDRASPERAESGIFKASLSSSSESKTI